MAENYIRKNLIAQEQQKIGRNAEQAAQELETYMEYDFKKPFIEALEKNHLEDACCWFNQLQQVYQNLAPRLANLPTETKNMIVAKYQNCTREANRLLSSKQLSITSKIAEVEVLLTSLHAKLSSGSRNTFLQSELDAYNQYHQLVNYFILYHNGEPLSSEVTRSLSYLLFLKITASLKVQGYNLTTGVSKELMAKKRKRPFSGSKN